MRTPPRFPGWAQPLHRLSALFTLAVLSSLPVQLRAAGPEEDLPVLEPQSDAADAAPGPEPAEPGPAETEAVEEADEETEPEARPEKKASQRSSARKRPAKSKLCSYRTPLHEHVVADGEHLGAIAGRYGVLRKDILEINPELKNPDLIRPGQKLLVCPELAPRTVHRVEYVVQPGDSVESIARAHELSVKELLGQQDPPLADPDHIVVGRKLALQVDGEIVRGFEPEVARRYDRGSLRGSHRLPKGAGYAIKRPHLAFGTRSTIATIQNVIDRYHRRADGGPLLHVGDISQEGGGPIKGHVSHQHGVDVDVGLVLSGAKKNEMRFHNATEKSLDVHRTWILVHEFLRTGQVRYIFLDYRLQKLLYEHARKTGVPESELDEYFQYPRGRGRNYGIVRHWKGHRNHIHVRFRR